MLWIPSRSFFATHLALNGGQLFEFNHRLHSCVLSAAGHAAKEARAGSKNAGNLNTWHGEITGYFCILQHINYREIVGVPHLLLPPHTQ
jgi:hypothetical protein